MAPARKKSARQMRRHPGLNSQAWLTRHLQVALGSLGKLLQTPLGTLMTVAVISIALALPAGLLVILSNLQQIGAQWDGPASISLFLKDEVDDLAATQLGQRIQSSESAQRVTLISRTQALEEFRAHSGFGAALDALDENPLPAVLLIQPRARDSGPKAAAELLARLQKLPEVDVAQLDLQWVQRLQGITEIARRGAYLIAALLGLAVLLIIGNTIRLEIQNRHDEIAITKLVGATDGFVRRPFLYHGFWLGLFGGLGAWLLVAAAVALLAPPVSHLAELYQSAFRLTGPALLEVAALIGGGAAIGWLGAGISVSRHIKQIEPD
jgi:cell division transport system permease protein